MMIIIPPNWLRRLITAKESALSEKEKEELEAWRKSQMIMMGSIGFLLLLALYAYMGD